MRACSLTVFGLLLSLLALFGCEEEGPPIDAVDNVTTITTDQAMQIASSDATASGFTATSTIIGPMQVHGQDITAYEVMLHNDIEVLLRYVDANTGELLTSEDVRHPMPVSVDDSVTSSAKTSSENYYTSCPSGWPLCIRTPSAITFYSQQDPNWKNWRMNGNKASTTIGQVGCLLSAYAMSSAFTGHGSRNSKDSDILADQRNCYYNSSNQRSETGDLIDGSCFASAVSASHTVISVNQVWSTLASGIPVVAFGNSNCLGNTTHAQMIWGSDGTRYWTKDPWYAWNDQDKPLCLSNVSYRVLR